MKSVSLIPYCPYPVDSGAKSIFIKHLTFLKEHGECNVASAIGKPVGTGWNEEHIKRMLAQGYTLAFRQDPLNLYKYLVSMTYGTFCKGFGLEKAFGHSNPYHRNAFPEEWWYRITSNADIAEIHYSYWAHLPTACPKVVILHDLWSDIMWEGCEKETNDLKKADLVVTLSHSDCSKLVRRGLKNVHWSPPCIEAAVFSDSRSIAMVGSGNRYNREGVNWFRRGLPKAGTITGLHINCYGAISSHIPNDEIFIPKGRYADKFTPYKDCGIVLILTASGTGTQIKGIEALASGRAIIARRGAMRGLPCEEKGWTEIDSPEEMFETLQQVVGNDLLRKKMMDRARTYYLKYLNKNDILESLLSKYNEITKSHR